MGNSAVEDLFVLAALASKERVRVIIAPTDFRVAPFVRPITQRSWIDSLYGDLKAELRQFKQGT
jgi:hypothetical protein